MARTKIVATAGPACESLPVLEAMMDAGADVIRLNMSHGSQEQHAATIARVREAAANREQPVALLLDLCGPKIRTGRLKGGRPVALEAGQRITITTEDIEGDARRVSTTYAALPQDVRAGDRILVADGAIELRVLRAGDSEVECEVVFGGALGEHKGINLPGVALSAPCLTSKDYDDLRFGLEQGVDLAALSFVRRAEDVRTLRREMERTGRAAPIIAKIEKPEALDALDAILDAADGVMVARGDLGVELSPEKVPAAQKRIIREANRRGKPVITATQMLESMIDSPRPTRAEASDVANAIIDGTDAVMLSGETAVGRFPVECVRMMERIAREIEDAGAAWEHAPKAFEPAGDLSHAAVAAGVAAARDVRAAAIVVFTLSGRTAELVSQRRPRAPIVAFTPDEAVYRRLALRWGVRPFRIEIGENTDALIREGERRLLELGLARPGDTVVCIAGVSPLRGAANMVKIDRLSPASA